MGVAEAKTFLPSVRLKDMFMGFQAEDTAILKRMFQDPVFGNSEKAQELFRELGDIGSLVGNDNSRMMIAARFGNLLNTKSDNMLKTASFSREIDKVIKADIFVDPKTGKTRSRGFKDKGITNLSDLINAGGLRQIDDKTLAQAMNTAMDFTYQTGKFRGRGGRFNDAALCL